MIGFFYFTTQFLQGVLGFTPLQAGLGFLPMTVVNFAVASAVPRLLRRLDPGVLLTLGVAVTLAGTGWLSLAEPGAGYLLPVAAPMVLVGAGQGLAFAPLTSFGIVDAPAQEAGAASGLVNTFHQLGMALGLAVLVALTASVAEPVAEFGLALRGATALLSLSLLVVLAGLLPAHRAALATTHTPQHRRITR
ncbi:putative transmembrane efflux protein [Serinicoccus hydrothermalis]|uniref:Putative transmembrane efflux protein n=1 Tax=Serinicoccus hydrothermalis TaxID=1758689 RepID=A0A1B1NC45_9MICO|nr:MFS transporter [Serinicoccus hydrothermalis]ANS78984.1 putative transmembrane efflux protein [Serinicoccus hydrothermalis]